MQLSVKPSDWRIRLGISLFILLNICTVLFVSTDSASSSLVGDILLPYAKATKLLQKWSLFSPQPRHYVQIYYFQAVRQDGSISTWQRPSPTNWSFFERQHAYNWQKFDSSSNHMEDRALWHDIAKWALHQFADESNPVLVLRLMRKYADIPTPNSKGDPLQYDGKNLDLGDQTLFTYSVPEQRIL